MKLTLSNLIMSNKQFEKLALELIFDDNIKPLDLISISKRTIDESYYISGKYSFYSKYNKILNTNVIIEKNLEIVSYKCRNDKCEGMCFHVIILLIMALKYLHPQEFDLERQKLNDVLEEQKSKMAIKKLVFDFDKLNVSSKSIHLLPCVCDYSMESYDTKGFYLSLKISSEKEYIIKDISSFLLAISLEKEVKYGAKLSFVHSMGAFDDRSQRLINFLFNATSKSHPKREIELNTSMLEEILDIYSNRHINFSIKGKDYYLLINEEIKDIEISLTDDKLYIDKENTNLEYVGIRYYYTFDNYCIRKYKFFNSRQRHLVETLSDIKYIMIKNNADDFITTLLPKIKDLLTIEDSFVEKYPMPSIHISSYFYLENSDIVLKEKIIENGEISTLSNPFVVDFTNGYYSVISRLGFVRDDKYRLKSIAGQYSFLHSNLDTLKKYGEVYLDEKIRKIVSTKSTKIHVKIRYDVNLLDFSFLNDSLTKEEIKDIINAYHHKQKFVRLKDDTILQIDNDDMKEITRFLNDFNISYKDIDKNVKKPINYILKLVDAEDGNVIFDNEVKKIITDLKEYKKHDYIVPDVIKDVLRPYQIDAFKWLKTLDKYGFGGILADDMGLGKTIEIISLLLSDEQQMPSLIVCPMSLVYNWQNECLKWHTDINCIAISGSALEREKIISNIKNDEKIIYVSSYDSLKRDLVKYQTKFRYIIIDEAQFIKNQHALKTQAVKQLEATNRFALTGTPVENGLSDLWSIFDFVMPDYLSNYNHFKEQYEMLIMEHDEIALQSLIKRITPFVLRRCKKDVLNDLPDKIETIYYCMLNDGQKKLYDTYLANLKNEIEQENPAIILSMLTRLRQICVDPALFIDDYEGGSAKLDMCIDVLKEAIISNHKVLIFSQFSTIFEELGKRLKEIDVLYLKLTGATPSKERIELVESFNDNDSIKVFLISLKAGGTGLNLTGADTVIHLDPWWNASVENQATDRAHRIGQKNTVQVIKLAAKNTIEQKVIDLQNAKKDLANKILANQEETIKMSIADIRKIL